MEKKTRGLVIGKFYPPHEGHHYLISTAEENCDQLDIILCERDYETEMPGKLRASWIKSRHPKAHIHIMKYTDEEGEAGSQFWASHTIRFLGYAPDIVFTSENYGELYSKLMGSKHILVDRKRETFPVSGTSVRDNPYDNWHLIDESVKAFYAVRVIILGAESTGKTTLAQDLARQLNTVWTPEYGRLYYDAKMNSEWGSEDFEFIAKSQKDLENQMAGKSNKILICDTDAMATHLWEKALTGKSTLNPEKFININERRIYLLADTDVPFNQDGTRDKKRRTKMQKDYIKLLSDLKIKYHLITGNRKQRINKAKKYPLQIITS